MSREGVSKLITKFGLPKWVVGREGVYKLITTGYKVLQQIKTRVYIVMELA
jgi:hypothetical protein